MRRPAIAMATAALALGMAACGGGAGTEAQTATTETEDPASRIGRYPPEARESFLQTCERSGTPSHCKCALEYMEDNVTLEEFTQAGIDIAEGKKAPKKISKAYEKCV